MNGRARDHNPARGECSGILLGRRDSLEAQGVESQHLEIGSAARAGEDLAPVHVELRDLNRMPAEGTGTQGGAVSVQLKSMATTRVVLVRPQSTRAEKDTTQKLRSMPDNVFPMMSRLRG